MNNDGFLRTNSKKTKFSTKRKSIDLDNEWGSEKQNLIVCYYKIFINF